MARIIGYSVDFSVCVDHPELRDASFRVRTAYSIAESRFSEGMAPAVAGYEGLLRGEDDFASEYVSSVSVWSLLDTGFRGRRARRKIQRYRAADGTMYDDSTPERAEAMRAAEMRDYSAKEAAQRALATSAGSLYL